MKFTYLALLSLLFVSCKNEKKKDAPGSSQIEASVSKGNQSASEDSKRAEVETAPTSLVLPEIGKLEGKTVVAKLKDGSSIPLQVLLPDLMKIPQNMLKENFAKIYEQALKIAVKMHILSLESKKNGMEKDPKVIEATKDVFQLLSQQHLLEAAVKERVKETELRAKYEELKKSLPKEDEISLRIIECKSKEEADQKLKNLETLKSTLDQQGKPMPWMRKAQIPTTAAAGCSSSEDIFRTAKGSFVKLPINFGPQKFAVVFVENKRPYDPVSYEDAREFILRQFFYPKVAEYLKELSDQYGVKKFTLNNKPLTPEITEKEASEGVDISKIPDNQVLVDYKNGKITWKSITNMIANREELKEIVKLDLYRKVIDSLITKELLKLEIEKQNLKNNPELQAKIHKTIEALRNKTYIDSKVSVTPEEVRAKYQEEVKLIPKNRQQIRLRWIVLESKEKAESILETVKSSGVNAFIDAAKKNSLDVKTKEKGGDLGYKIEQEVGDAQLWKLVVKQAKSTVVPTVYEMAGKFLVIRVEDKKEAKIPTFAETEKTIEDQLRKVKSRAFVDQLYSAYTPNLFKWDGTPLQEKTANVQPIATK